MTGTVKLNVDIQAQLEQLRAEGAPIQDALAAISTQWCGWLDDLTMLQEVLRVAQEQRATPVVHGSGLLTTSSQHRQPSTPVEEDPKKPPGGAPATSPEDDALLATLDERTAALVRVRRRLSMNTKSFRECLADIQQERAAPKSEGSKKPSWWS